MRHPSILLAGLAGAGRTCAEAAALERDHLTLGVDSEAVLFYLPLTAAERLGYFRE